MGILFFWVIKSSDTECVGWSMLNHQVLSLEGHVLSINWKSSASVQCKKATK